MESRILVNSFQGITRRQKFLVPMVNSIIRQHAFRHESLSKTANKLGICLRREYCAGMISDSGNRYSGQIRYNFR